jgi:extradiol dioxygenase family protein
MQFHPAIPVLRVFDHTLAKKFYVDWLGFKIDWEHQFDAAAPRYLQVSRGGAVVHLSEHYGDCSPGAKAMVEVDDVEALHREVQSRPNPNMNPGVETEPWNAKTMTVIDPFGNRLVFYQPHAK